MMDYLLALAGRVTAAATREAEKRDAEMKAHDDALAAAADYIRDLDARGAGRSG